MKTLRRWALRLFLLLAALLAACVLARDFIAREIAEYALSRATGLRADIGKIHVEFSRPRIAAADIVLHNDAHFGGGTFIEAPEVYLEYDYPALRAGKIHCALLRVNVARVHFVEDAAGRRNLDELEKNLLSHDLSAKNRSRKKIKFAGIDSLNLTLGKATYTRLGQPGTAQELSMNVDHLIFARVESAQDFESVLIVALLKSNANLMEGGNSQTWLQLFNPRKF